MVGLALGETRRFADPLVGLVRVLLGVVLRLLLEVPEFAHAVLPCLSGPALLPGHASALLPLCPAPMRKRLRATFGGPGDRGRIGHAGVVAFTMKQCVQTDLEADREVANTLADLIIGGWLVSGIEDQADDDKPGRRAMKRTASVHNPCPPAGELGLLGFARADGDGVNRIPTSATRRTLTLLPRPSWSPRSLPEA